MMFLEVEEAIHIFKSAECEDMKDRHKQVLRQYELSSLSNNKLIKLQNINK